MSILPEEFYLDDDVVHLSKQLIGKVLVTQFPDGLTSGMIIETEAYRAPEDRASHAFGNRKTKRNAVMFGPGGYTYVYLCYGIHRLFNIVTNVHGIPHAILIRAIKPIDGIEIMRKRRGKKAQDSALASGPGTVTQALGIKLEHNGLPLSAPPLWIEDRGLQIDPLKIEASTRIGIDYAGEDAKHLWRFTYGP